MGDLRAESCGGGRRNTTLRKGRSDFIMQLKTIDRPSPTLNALQQQRARKRASDWVLVVLLAVILLGVVIRSIHVLSTDFPLNDGGLFYIMVEDLRQAQYHLPAFTSYNAARIPFAYPPLSFYVAGLLADYTPVGLLDLLRYLPLIMSCATIPAFVLLARDLLASPVEVLAAVFAFAVIPRSFTWNLMGGGLSRSFGFLFAILALHHVYRLYTERQWRSAGWATLFAALTVLSHLGTAPFLAFSILLFLIIYGRHKHAILSSLAIAVGTVVLTAPWWATILLTHGAAPLLAANQSGGSLFSDVETRRVILSLIARLGIGSWNWNSTGEPLFPLIGTFALLGLLCTVGRKRFDLAVWWLIILVLDVRAGATYASLPVAMLAAIGMIEVLHMLRARSGGNELSRRSAERVVRADPNGTRVWQTLGLSWPAWLMVGLLVCYAVLSALVKHPAVPSDIRFLVSLFPEERAAMRWVAEATPADSRFLVIPESQWNGWPSDKTSEWFPALARRISIATVQGSEWLPGKEFDRRAKSSKDLQRCGGGRATCIDRWAEKQQASFTHIYIPNPPVGKDETYLLCCLELINALRQDARYELIYDRPGAVVFARR